MDIKELLNSGREENAYLNSVASVSEIMIFLSQMVRTKTMWSRTVRSFHYDQPKANAGCMICKHVCKVCDVSDTV